MNLSLVLLCIPIKLKLKIQDAGMSNRSSIAANFKIISTIDNVKKIKLKDTSSSVVDKTNIAHIDIRDESEDKTED